MWRRITASVLVVLGALLLLIASFGWWANRYFLNSDRFSAKASQIVANEDVQDALTAAITNKISQQSGRDIRIRGTDHRHDRAEDRAERSVHDVVRGRGPARAPRRRGRRRTRGGAQSLRDDRRREERTQHHRAQSRRQDSGRREGAGKDLRQDPTRHDLQHHRPHEEGSGRGHDPGAALPRRRRCAVTTSLEDVGPRGLGDARDVRVLARRRGDRPHGHRFLRQTRRVPAGRGVGVPNHHARVWSCRRS